MELLKRYVYVSDIRGKGLETGVVCVIDLKAYLLCFGKHLTSLEICSVLMR